MVWFDELTWIWSLDYESFGVDAYVDWGRCDFVWSGDYFQEEG